MEGANANPRWSGCKAKGTQAAILGPPGRRLLMIATVCYKSVAPRKQNHDIWKGYLSGKNKRSCAEDGTCCIPEQSRGIRSANQRMATGGATFHSTVPPPVQEPEAMCISNQHGASDACLQSLAVDYRDCCTRHEAHFLGKNWVGGKLGLGETVLLAAGSASLRQPTHPPQHHTSTLR